MQPIKINISVPNGSTSTQQPAVNIFITSSQDQIFEAQNNAKALESCPSPSLSIKSDSLHALPARYAIEPAEEAGNSRATANQLFTVSTADNGTHSPPGSASNSPLKSVLRFATPSMRVAEKFADSNVSKWVGRPIKFIATPGIDVISQDDPFLEESTTKTVQTTAYSITMMQQYQYTSFEELRAGDYSSIWRGAPRPPFRPAWKRRRQ